jgi:hypothetical protein
MGLNSARRAAVRGNAKAKFVVSQLLSGFRTLLTHDHRPPSEAGRSVSPVSDAGNASDSNGKGKGKVKGKKAGPSF